MTVKSMNIKKAVFLFFVVIALFYIIFLTYSLFSVDDKKNNTNQCISSLQAIQSCQELNNLGLPNNLEQCCNGVRSMVESQCGCNPAIDILLGEEGKKIYQLEAVCRIADPFTWASIPPSAINHCDSVKTYDYGCSQSDVEIDALRLQNAMDFKNLFAEAADETACLNTPKFVKDLEKVFTEDATLTVPYGIGKYEGYEGIAEYLGIAFGSLNHGFWQYDLTVYPDKPAKLEVSEDGKVWTQALSFSGSFFRGLSPYSDKYVGQDIIFEGCEARVSQYNVIPTEGIRDWVERFVQTAERSDRWGVKDICRYHTKFCSGDPKTKQYESEQECLEYIGSLPSYSKACGINRPLAGSSLSCKFKHHFMIPANPGLHCAHIGRNGTHDANHHLKCDDTAECGDPNQGDDWPLVQKIGVNTPDDIKTLIDINNQGAEAEPFGCAIPTQ